jgi:putative hydrolase of the HAD superfamily
MIRTILFDLDDTLYPPEAGIMPEIRKRILEYTMTRLDLPMPDADALRRRYFLEYGTSMRGLQINHQIDPDDFLHFVHDIPIKDLLGPNAELDGMLSGLEQDKVIFTNASREHAERVLEALGVRRHFSRIVDVRDMAYESKPQPSAYRRICHLLGVRAKECMLVEDNVRNIRPAKAHGMTTTLILDGQPASDPPNDPSVDFTVRRVEELGELFRQFASLRLGPEATP